MRHGHRLLVWLGGLTGLLILVAVVGIWRLLQGPIELDSLVPYVERALRQSGEGIGVAVAGVSIGLDRDTRQLDLRARDVRLTTPDGEKLANLPEMAASFSVGAMLGGRVEPTRVVIDRPVLALNRDANGALSFSVGNADTAGDPLGLQDALALFKPPQPDAPWSELRQAAIRDATIIVDDRVSGTVWRADHAAASLERGADSANGEISLTIALGGSAPRLHATYRYAPGTERLDLHAGIEGLDPTALAPLSSVLSPLGQFQVPVSGTADLSVDLATGQPASGRVDLGLGAGQIESDLPVSGKLPVASGELHAVYAPDSAELRLDKLALDLHGGTTLTVTGRLGGVRPLAIAAGATPPDKLAGALDVTLTHLPVSRAGALWPRGVAVGGRKWVGANLSDGMFDELTARLAVSVDPSAMTADFSDAHAAMRFRDMTVDYFNGLPPAKKVAGTVTLEGKRLDVALTGGAVKSLKVSTGVVSVTNLGAPVETLTADVSVAGPLQEALETLDAKPLHYAHDAGIDPARLGGKADAQLHFQLPLVNALKLDDVDYGAKATLTGVSYARVAFDRPLTDGNFTLELGHDGVHAKGGGRFDGSATTFDGNLYFRPKTGPRSLYRIGVTVDDEARQRLGWGFLADRLAGPIPIAVTYTVPANGKQSEVVAKADLGAATLTFDEVPWQKPPQIPATARLAATLADDVVLAIPAIDITAPGLDGKFAIALSAGGKTLDRVDIRHLAIGDNDFGGTVSRRPGGGWLADIRGLRLNLHHALKRALEDDKPDSLVPLAVNARIARLLLGPHREMREVTAALLRERGSWQSIKIEGQHTNGRPLSLTLAASDATGQRLRLRSDDLGATFALFGIADNVAGGKLTVDGTVGDSGGHQTVRAHIDGHDYSLARAPVVAKLLSLTSLDGIAALMTGAGIPFTTLRGDVTFSRGVITLDPVVAYGGAIGVSATGWLNPGEDRIEIDGTLAPAYALNSVLGNFPVLGPLLIGGEGQGLFAAKFRLSGSNDDPTVTVNPLSALTPGLLRHLFDPFTSAPPPNAPQQAAQPTTTAPAATGR